MRYKGYRITKGKDSNFLVCRGRKLIDSVDTVALAKDLIEDLPSHDLRKNTEKYYCIKVLLSPTDKIYHYLCNNGEFLESIRVTSRNVLKFDSRARATQVLKYLPYYNMKVERYR